MIARRKIIVAMILTVSFNLENFFSAIFYAYWKVHFIRIMNVFQISGEGSRHHVLSKSRARSGEKNVRFLENWHWSFSNYDGMVDKATRNLVVFLCNKKFL